MSLHLINKQILWSLEPSDRTRRNGPNLKHRRFHLNSREHFLSVRVIEHWHRLPREVVESHSLEILKTCPEDMVLGNQLSVALPEQGVGAHDLQRCLPTSTSLWFCEILCLVIDA